MNAKHSLLVVLVAMAALMSLQCSEDKTTTAGSSPRIVGNTSLAAELLDILLPEDCGPGTPAVSALTGRVNNVDLNEVKIMLYSLGGEHYGTLRVFNDDGTFSMDLPCDRRVRLLLTSRAWESSEIYDTGPPDLSDNVLAAYWDVDRVLGTVYGTVADAFDNNLLADVEVSWEVDGTTEDDATNANGYFSGAAGLASGDYSFEFELAGYARVVQVVTVPTVDDIRNGPDHYPGDVVYPQFLTVSLPPLTADLSGSVYAVDPDSADTLPAADVIVVVSPGGGVQPGSYDGLTTVEGMFEFESIPAVVSTDVSVASFALGGHTYGPADTSLTFWPGNTVLTFVLETGGGLSVRIEEPLSAR